MIKVRILTFWGVPNYGAFAQAYALNSLLKKEYGFADVKHLAYLHPKHHDLYFKRRRPNLSSIKQILSPRYYKDYLKYLICSEIRYPAFSKDWNSVDHIVVSNDEELEKMFFDVIITGSDAIWEYSIPEFGDDIHLIGNNLSCDRLVSYAASFGNMNVSDEFKPWIINGLKKYDMISVRDQNSKEIIEKLIDNSDVNIVLDPTLLWDFRDDKNIPESNYKDYILVYGDDFPENLINDVKRYAKEKSFTIIGAGIAPQWCDMCLTDIGPLEWIGLFRSAAFIVTGTFHGLMFSINYGKKVVFNQVQYVKNRSNTLLQELGLADLYKNGPDLNTVLNYDWNYKEIYHKLDYMRTDSLNFIKGIIEDG